MGEDAEEALATARVMQHSDHDLAGLTVPTLVISTTDDGLTSPALHRHLAETIPGAHLADIATGYPPMLERTDEWLQLIIDFLGKHHA